ncbi:MAG: XdhC family protein [Eubacteriales bacterium]|nr:XdhC family protein [Eubacteriales bacterium]
MNNRYKELAGLLAANPKGVIHQFTIPTESGSLAELSGTFLTGDDLNAENADEILLNGIPVLESEDEKLIFREPFYRQERLIIMGAGHVGELLSRLAKITGYYVIVCDDRPEYANKERLTDADEVYCSSFAQCVEWVSPRSTDYVVIVTKDHQCDTDCLTAMLDYEEPLYLGMIGSKARVRIVFNELEQEGYSRERLDRVCNPIGLPIGSKTVEEIAISIMAEVIQYRRKESRGCAYIDRSDHNIADILDLGTIERPCAMVVLLETHGSAPRRAGACMAVFEDGSIMGSTGGGSAEGEMIELAQSLIGTGRYQIYRANFNTRTGIKASMVCGGHIAALVWDVPVDA